MSAIPTLICRKCGLPMEGTIVGMNHAGERFLSYRCSLCERLDCALRLSRSATRWAIPAIAVAGLSLGYAVFSSFYLHVVAPKAVRP